MARTPVIFDTDGGVDDYSALWYALTSPAIDTVAVTTVRGVLGAAETARNVAKVLAAAGRSDLPFAVGAEEPLGPRPDFPDATMMHGEDGLGNVHRPDVGLAPRGESGAELIVRLARQRPRELTVVAVGPFTNVALALRAEPELPELLGGLVIMGGAARPPGNATPLAEFNVACDPTAANEMARAPWSRPPLMVGLDVTMIATMDEAEFDVLNARRTPQAEFMADPFVLYREMSSIESGSGCPSHDTLTMMSIEDPDLLTAEELPLVVDVGGDAAWGATVVDFRARWLAAGRIPDEFRALAEEEFFAGKGRWRIALDVDVERFRGTIRDFYGERRPG